MNSTYADDHILADLVIAHPITLMSEGDREYLAQHLENVAKRVRENSLGIKRKFCFVGTFTIGTT